MHEFNESCRVEDRWAPILDEWLGEVYDYRKATMDEQWRGIDRVAKTEDGQEVGVEYKCDERAGRTGNIFIETVSNDRTHRPGWAYTTQSDWIFYFVTPDKVLAFLARRIREALPGWKARYRERAADNGEYRTLGLCVPIVVAEEVAEYVALLSSGDGAVLSEKDDNELD